MISHIQQHVALHGTLSLAEHHVYMTPELGKQHDSNTFQKRRLPRAAWAGAHCLQTMAATGGVVVTANGYEAAPPCLGWLVPVSPSQPAHGIGPGVSAGQPTSKARTAQHTGGQGPKRTPATAGELQRVRCAHLKSIKAVQHRPYMMHAADADS